MDWLRWYHGSCTDPKFRVVAKKAAMKIEGVRVSDVLAVWSMLLERASKNESRGCFLGFDCEAADEAFGLPDGASFAILGSFEAKELIKDGRIANWEKRQPKREREDDSSGRVKAYRERQKQTSNATCNDVTPCNATQHQETPRGEEIREEVRKDTIALPTRSERDFESFWQAYPRKKSKGQAQKTWEKMAKAKKLPAMPTILAAIAAAKAGQDWQRDGGKFIPHPGTWLNAMGWKDEGACDLGLDSKFAGAQ